MSLATARQSVADALNTVAGLDIRVRAVKTPKPGDGWVTVSRLAPGGYRTSNMTFVALVVLGADEANAEALFEQLAVAALDAVTTLIACAAVALEPALLPVGANAAPLHGFTLTLTMED